MLNYTIVIVQYTIVYNIKSHTSTKPKGEWPIA